MVIKAVEKLNSKIKPIKRAVNVIDVNWFLQAAKLVHKIFSKSLSISVLFSLFSMSLILIF